MSNNPSDHEKTKLGFLECKDFFFFEESKEKYFLQTINNPPQKKIIYNINFQHKHTSFSEVCFLQSTQQQILRLFKFEHIIKPLKRTVLIFKCTMISDIDSSTSSSAQCGIYLLSIPYTFRDEYIRANIP